MVEVYKKKSNRRYIQKIVRTSLTKSVCLADAVKVLLIHNLILKKKPVYALVTKALGKIKESIVSCCSRIIFAAITANSFK
jgi:hypothetical protein